LIAAGVSNSSASKLTINSYALSTNSYASAAGTCIYKVEVIR
jgi:hypothetical protein